MPNEFLPEDDILLNDNEVQSDSKDKNKSLSGKPVGLLILLSVLVIVALIVTARQWVQNLKLPFLVPQTQRTDNINILTDNDLSNFLVLQAKDTDNDTLSDYDELYLYYTSPYLEDSDSDGLNDAEEIKNNTDPNCPKGSQCSTAVGQTTPSSPTSQLNLESIAHLTSDQLRSLLIQQGMSAEEVDQLDEETLRRTFLENVNDISPTGSDFSYLLSGTDVNLTPDQLRQLLIGQGVNKEEVDKLSDEELSIIWQQALEQFEQDNNP
ncbi:hypothetical protein KKF32_01990 [Patescibacteria group bacterium]|nr:hypothetical protein [Patescibacteria group bacterium]